MENDGGLPFKGSYPSVPGTTQPPEVVAAGSFTDSLRYNGERKSSLLLLLLLLERRWS